MLLIQVKKSTADEKVVLRHSENHRRRNPEPEYIPGVEWHEKLDRESKNRRKDNGVPVGQVAHVNQDVKDQVSGKREDVLHVIESKQLHDEHEVKHKTVHDHPAKYQLCSEVMDKVLQITEPMKK